MYFAIIGDMIGSREINKAKRNEVQNKLRDTLEEINQTFDQDIASKFLITIGDEFQGLLLNPINLIRMVDIIQFRMHPVKIRFGLGVGELDTDIIKEMSIGADGPAYHNARNMVETLKTLQKAKMSGNSNIMIADGKAESSCFLDHLNMNFQLCSFLENKWTDKQRELISMIYIEEKNQMEAAKELQVAQSSVQRRLKSAGFYEYYNARTLNTKTIKELWGKKDE